jgi:hypothetical protein
MLVLAIKIETATEKLGHLLGILQEGMAVFHSVHQPTQYTK